MPYVSHDIMVPNQTVNLSPFAVLRTRGQICDTAKSAVRALHIIEVLTSAQGPLRAIEIARSLDLSPSSANQLLKTMVDSAYLIFDPISKLYRLSPRVAKFGASLADDYFGPGKLDRLMRKSQEMLGGRIDISTCQGSFMQLLDVGRPRVERNKVGIDSHIGFRVPLFGSCIGAAWLCAQSEEKIRASIRLSRRELGRSPDAAGILARIAQVREQGYAFGGVSADDDIRAIALPLPPCPNSVVLVLSTSGPAERMEREKVEVVAVLRTIAKSTLGNTRINDAMAPAA